MNIYYMYYAKHFEILLVLLRDSIIIIILAKFAINLKINVETTRYLFNASIYFAEIRKLFYRKPRYSVRPYLTLIMY